MINNLSEDNLLPEQRLEVECELDVLNQTAPQINILENELLIARLNYQEALTDNANKLKALGDRLGKCVQRARPYYELCAAQTEKIAQIQRATKRYTNAISALHSAREELANLESTIGVCQNTDLLEEMNQAILRINSTKQEVAESYNAHQQLLKAYNAEEQTLRRMERRNKSDIAKSRPYFETKGRLDRNMRESKLQVDLCAEKVSLCKSIYADAMCRLERISVSVHDTRRRQTMSSNQSSSPPSSLRGQGVGAESVESFAELSCPGSDVFSSSPRLNEKNIFPPESTLDVSAVSPPKVHPFVNGLLQQIHDAAAKLVVFDNSIRSNSPTCRRVESLPHPTPIPTNSCLLTQPHHFSCAQEQLNPEKDLHVTPSCAKSNVQSCRNDQRSFANSPFNDVWNCLPVQQDMQETFLSSSCSNMYLKRAHSSSELRTSCVKF